MGSTPTHERLQMGLYEKTKTLLSKQGFIYFVLLIFIVQAAYIAIHSAYPMAFDEAFHFGIIQLYAHQWSPYFAHLSPSTGQYGPLATDPSYLYHYLASFPYRLFALFNHSQVDAIIFLRLLSVGLFTVGIMIFRYVLLATKASKALVNLVILVFTLLPITSFAAAQINYDNLLFPLTAGAILLTLRFTQRLKTENYFDTRLVILSLCLCLFASQVKYAFLPIFVGLGMFLLVVTFKWWRQNKHNASGLIARDISKYTALTKLALIGLLLISASMFGWRYGYNLVKYNSIVPNCESVLNVSACQQYGVWDKSYQLSLLHAPSRSLSQFIAFDKAWVHIMGDELFTIVNANGGTMVDPVSQFVKSAVLIAIVGGLFIVAYSKKLLRLGSPIILFLTIIICYLGALFLQNYNDYTRYGIPIAVQGRYLLPVILLLLMIGAQAYALALRESPRYKGILAVCLVVVCLQGGGIITYQLRTNSSWYWNHSAQTHLNRGLVLMSLPK